MARTEDDHAQSSTIRVESVDSQSDDKIPTLPGCVDENGWTCADINDERHAEPSEPKKSRLMREPRAAIPPSGIGHRGPCHLCKGPDNPSDPTIQPCLCTMSVHHRCLEKKRFASFHPSHHFACPKCHFTYQLVHSTDATHWESAAHHMGCSVVCRVLGYWLLVLLGLFIFSAMLGGILAFGDPQRSIPTAYRFSMLSITSQIVDPEKVKSELAQYLKQDEVRVWPFYLGTGLFGVTILMLILLTILHCLNPKTRRPAKPPQTVQRRERQGVGSQPDGVYLGHSCDGLDCFMCCYFHGGLSNGGGTCDCCGSCCSAAEKCDTCNGCGGCGNCDRCNIDNCDVNLNCGNGPDALIFVAIGLFIAIVLVVLFGLVFLTIIGLGYFFALHTQCVNKRLDMARSRSGAVTVADISLLTEKQLKDGRCNAHGCRWRAESKDNVPVTVKPMVMV